MCEDYFVDAVGNGKSIQMEKRLHNLSRCVWNKSTGNVICSNYKRSTNPGLNKIMSYLDLAVKSTCRCQPSITLCKHSRVERSGTFQSKNSKHLLRQENAYSL